MKITLEFTDAERFMKELPQFAKVIGFASEFVTFSRAGKKDGDVEIQADVPKVINGPNGEHLALAGDADRIIEAAKKVGAYTEKAPEKPQDAPKETDDKVPTETAKALENAKSEASANKEKPAEIMPKPVEDNAADIAACRKILHAKIKAGYREEMKALLAKLGAENVSTLDSEKYAEFVSEANKIGGDNNA
ncbi:MAG: hypothetical protein MR671_00125 [Clostridiales bacterium]|nr:hypothetical protein [Clostridiales bacterium]